MNTLQVFRALGPIDLRGIRRDSALSWMIFLPLFSALLLRWGIPPLTRRLLDRYSFDLIPYYPVLLAYFFVIMTPITFAVVIGFLLLDEKDDHTLTALQVTPLSLNHYLAYRITIPVALTLVMILIIFPLSGLSDLAWPAVLLTALAAAPLAPLFALYLASFAQNKVQGFALMKLSGVLLVIPIFAFFLPTSWQPLFGIIPTYWPMKLYWELTAGPPTLTITLPLILALLYPSLLITLLTRRFNTTLHR